MRSKKKIKEMMPVRQWISRDEACAFLDISLTTFKQHIQSKLTASSIGNKFYYKVSELEQLIEENILVKQTA